MLYNYLKIFHILSAAIVLTSIGYSFHLWRAIAKSTRAFSLIERIQKQTLFVVAPFAIFQLASGFTLISLQHYDWSQLWIGGSVAGFIVVVASWFAFIYFLIASQQVSAQEGHSQLKFYRRAQSIMLSLCAVALLSMVFFMANKVISLHG